MTKTRTTRGFADVLVRTWAEVYTAEGLATKVGEEVSTLVEAQMNYSFNSDGSELDFRSKNSKAFAHDFSVELEVAYEQHLKREGGGK